MYLNMLQKLNSYAKTSLMQRMVIKVETQWRRSLLHRTASSPGIAW